jgi:glycosyltransferase involved in cell wall biosynthesis
MRPLRILFVSDLNYLPQQAGGTQSLIHELAIALRDRGHDPVVLAPLRADGPVGLKTRAVMKLTGRETVRDGLMGYPVYRRWSLVGPLDDAIDAIRPDVAIVMPRAAVPMAAELVRLSVPTLVYFQDVELQQLGGDPRSLQGVGFASNSHFTADRYAGRYGIDSVVIPPLIQPDRYRTVCRPANVTMINPHPLKGGGLALDIAEACPEIPFALVSCWTLPDPERVHLTRRVRALGNVLLQPATADMKSVYGRAKILLVPSRWEEAWGRVASEAHVTGIPVIASDRGGLRESVGPGGILLDPDGPLGPWVDAVRSLWCDGARYAELSSAALAYSRRPAIAPGRLISRLLVMIRRQIERTGEEPDAPSAGQMIRPAQSVGAI